MEYVNLVLPPLLAFILSIQRVRNDYEIEDETGIIQFSFWSRYFLGYAIIYGAFAIFFYFLFTGQIDIPTDLGLQTTDTGNPKDGNTPNPQGATLTVIDTYLYGIAAGLMTNSLVAINLYSINFKDVAIPLSANSLLSLFTRSLKRGIAYSAYTNFDSFLTEATNKLSGEDIRKVRNTIMKK